MRGAWRLGLERPQAGKPDRLVSLGSWWTPEDFQQRLKVHLLVMFHKESKIPGE